MRHLAARVEKLERARQQNQVANTVPVFFVADGGGDRSRPLEVKHEGEQWTQDANETKEEFKDRVIAAALATFKPKHPLQALFLRACHPAIGREGREAKRGTPR